jgi:hypothetical protein
MQFMQCHAGGLGHNAHFIEMQILQMDTQKPCITLVPLSAAD